MHIITVLFLNVLMECYAEFFPESSHTPLIILKSANITDFFKSVRLLINLQGFNRDHQGHGPVSMSSLPHAKKLVQFSWAREGHEKSYNQHSGIHHRQSC